MIACGFLIVFSFIKHLSTEVTFIDLKSKKGCIVLKYLKEDRKFEIART